MSLSIDDTDIHLLLKYPMIMKSTSGDTITYQGSIDVNEEVYEMSITVPPDKKFHITLSEEYKVLEQEFNMVSQNIFPKNIVTYLDALKVFIENNVSNNQANHCDIYLHVLQEYSEFTGFYFNLKSNTLSYDLTKISITMQDEMNREHSLVIQINYDGKEIFEIIEYDLPQQKDNFQASSSLRVVYDQFVAVIGELQPFFNLMEIIDSNCWVLDPTESKRCFRYRRILIEDNLSVILTVQPFSIWQLPDIKFLGPENRVDCYRNTLNENLEKWEPTSVDIFSEILKLLGLTKFPQKTTQPNVPQDDILWQNGDCSICYSSRLNDKLPEVICKNSFCQNCFHIECLYEWLISVNSRKVFNQLIGDCPNCEKRIDCPIPS